MKLSRAETLELIQTRLDQKIYDPGGVVMGYRWSWGQWRGHDIQDLPTEYLSWHVAHNDRLSQFHLEWCLNHFAVCDWRWPEWQPPQESLNLDPEGHYSHSPGTQGHYSGSEPRREPRSEDLYGFRRRQAQGLLPQGREIAIRNDQDQG